MTRPLRLLAILLAVIVLLPLVAVVAAVALLDGETLRPYAEDAASTALGKPVAIGGLALDKGWTTGATLTDVAVEGEDGGAIGTFGEIDVAVRLLSALEDTIDMERLHVADAEIVLRRDADGRLNWQGAEEAAPAPEGRAELPILRDFALSNVVLDYADAAGTAERLAIARLAGSAVPGEDVRLKGEGTARGERVTLALTGGPAEGLLAAEAPWPVRLSLDGPLRLDVEGRLAPAGLDGTALAFSVAGPDIAALGTLAGVPLPETPPYALDGTLAIGEGVYRLADFAGTIGESDAQGSLEADLSGDLPRLAGEIRSKKLVFDDLAGLIGVDPGDTAEAEPEVEGDGLFPKTEVPVEPLRTAEIDLRLTADEVVAPVTQVESLDLRFRLGDDRLLVRPLAIGLAGGRASGEVALNVREAAPSADVALAIEDVDLARLAEGDETAEATGGTLSGRVYLLGTGASLDAMLTSARGGGHLILSDGAISGLAVEAVGLDAIEAIGLALGGDEPIPAPCAGLALGVEDGRVAIERAFVSTADSLVLAEGWISLADETLDIRAEGRAMDFSLIDLNSPVRLHGHLADPSIGIGSIDPLPFFEMGEEGPADCAALVAEARETAPGVPR
ncbi:MAG: AsmA family protein [Paracoccaceae bacterium]